MLRELNQNTSEDRLLRDVVIRVAMDNIPNCYPRRIMSYQGGNIEFPLIIPIIEDPFTSDNTLVDLTGAIRVTGECIINFQSYFARIYTPLRGDAYYHTDEIILGYGEELRILAIANIEHVRSIIRRMMRTHGILYDDVTRHAIEDMNKKLLKYLTDKLLKPDNSPSIGGQPNLITGDEPSLQRDKYKK